MPSMIAIPNYDAKFILHGENGSRKWHPCRVVGVSHTTNGPWFIARVKYPSGVIRAEELPQVFALDAEMPAA